MDFWILNASVEWADYRYSGFDLFVDGLSWVYPHVEIKKI
jgi:hypothetical protein